MNYVTKSTTRKSALTLCRDLERIQGERELQRTVSSFSRVATFRQGLQNVLQDGGECLACLFTTSCWPSYNGYWGAPLDIVIEVRRNLAKWSRKGGVGATRFSRQVSYFTRHSRLIWLDGGSHVGNVPFTSSPLPLHFNAKSS